MAKVLAGFGHCSCSSCSGQPLVAELVRTCAGMACSLSLHLRLPLPLAALELLRWETLDSTSCQFRVDGQKLAAFVLLLFVILWPWDGPLNWLRLKAEARAGLPEDEEIRLVAFHGVVYLLEGAQFGDLPFLTFQTLASL